MIINEQSKLDFLDVAKLAAAVADCSYAMVIFKQEKSFEIQATFGESIGIDCDLEVFQQIIRTGQPLYIEDLNEYSCLERPGALKSIRFFLGVPILSSSAEVQGILAVMHEEPIRLKRAQVDLVETLSHQVSNILIERLKMQELNRFSKMMEEIHHLNNKSGSLDSLFDEYLRKGLQVLGLEFGIISGVFGGIYTVDYVISPEDVIKAGACFSIADTYCSTVVDSAQTVYLDHVGCDETMCKHPAYKAMKLESYIGTPIHINGNIIGTLNFSSLNVRRRSYSKEEVKFVEILAQMISSKIEKLESNKTLAENAEWVNMAISGSGVAFWAFDTQKQIIQINKGVSDLFDVGGGVLKVSLADWVESIYPPDQAKVLDAFNGVKHGMLDVSLEFRKENRGQLRHIKVVGRVREGSWQVNNKVFGASWDITNQKNKETELEDSLKQFQTLAELAPIGIFLTDKDGGSKYLNQRWLSMSGLTRKQGEGTGWGQALHEDDREDVFIRWEEIVQNGQEWNRNFRIRNVIDGQVTHVHTKATPLKDSEGNTTGYVGINLDITEQLELEEQLLSNVKQLESFIGSIPSGVAMFDKEMRYKAASKKWLKDCGLEGKDVIGVCHYDLNHTLPERWKQGHQEALKGSWLSCKDDSYIKSDGQVEWLDWDVRPWHDSNGEIGGILMQVDVTTQKKFEQYEYNKVSEIQKVMLDNTAYSMIATDTKGIVTVFNKGAEKLLGYTAEEVIGKHSPVIFHDLVEIQTRAFELSEEFDVAINPGFDVVVHKCKMTGEVDLNNWNYVSKDGSRVPISLSVSPMKNKDNEIFGYLGIAQDITTKIKYENKLIEAKERAVENSEMKSRFLANMSHEIRTPLNSIIGLSDLLSQESIDGEALKYIKTIHDSSEVLLNIVNDILDLSKIEANEMKLCKAPFNLKDAVNKIIGLFEWQLNEKRIGLFLEFDDSLGEFYEGDEGRLHQVLVNLLGNAMKFTLEGSVTLSVTSNTSSLHGGNIIFKVIDTGIGIPSAKLKSIFESFSQAESSTTKRFGGTGLGLSITKQLVDLMGGDVWVDSGTGDGSTFSFTVDMKQVESSPILVEQEKRSSQASSEVELKVLLVDDAINNRNLVKAFLKDERYLIVEAQNGQEAFELLREDKFDIVLMDMQMPVMDGFKATELFRTWEKENGCGRTPVIALTAYALEEEKQRSFNAGCDYHLAKPLKKKVLIEAIDTHVELLSTSA